MSGDAYEALDAIEGVEGWLTAAQALRLWRAARGAGPASLIVEIGAFRGRSAIMLARGSGGGVTCIDPHAGSDRGPQEISADAVRGDADIDAFRANLAAGGVAEQITHLRVFSDEASVDGAIDVLFVDGAHRYGPARADIRDWGAQVAPGGRMLVHDSFSSVGVTLALLREVVFSRRWRWRGRDGSLAEWSREPARPGDVAVQLGQLGWFARNVVLKALILARLKRGPWPY